MIGQLIILLLNSKLLHYCAVAVTGFANSIREQNSLWLQSVHSILFIKIKKLSPHCSSVNAALENCKAVQAQGQFMLAGTKQVHSNRIAK